eukprot:Rmarinus@m.7006
MWEYIVGSNYSKGSYLFLLGVILFFIGSVDLLLNDGWYVGSASYLGGNILFFFGCLCFMVDSYLSNYEGVMVSFQSYRQRSFASSIVSTTKETPQGSHPDFFVHGSWLFIIGCIVYIFGDVYDIYDDGVSVVLVTDLVGAVLFIIGCGMSVVDSMAFKMHVNDEKWDSEPRYLYLYGGISFLLGSVSFVAGAIADIFEKEEAPLDATMYIGGSALFVFGSCYFVLDGIDILNRSKGYTVLD